MHIVVKPWSELNERQLMVLRRVADPAEPVTSMQAELALTVHALRDRGLVATPRAGGIWTARLTDAGRFYLEHGRHSDRPAASQSAVTKRPQAAARVTTGDVEPEVSAAVLLRRLQEEGGRVRIADPDPVTRAAWRRAINAAIRQGLVSAGRRLRHCGRDSGDLVIELVDDERPAPQSRPRQPARIDVPGAVDWSHPLMAQLRDNPRLLGVSEQSRPRALLLVQALAAEVERRGHHASLDPEGQPGIHLTIGRWSCRLIMGEEYDTIEHLSTSTELVGQKVYAWQRVQPQIRKVASGRLTLELPEDWQLRGRKRRWADRTRWRLDNKLGEVLAEVEARAALAEQQRAAKEQARLQRRQQWEQAMQHATDQFVQQHRRQALLDQVAAWQRAAQIRAYAEALTQVADQQQDPDRAAAVSKWAQWARDHADAIDPLLHHPQQPEDPEPRPEELRPYLGRWSPYGPDGGI